MSEYSLNYIKEICKKRNYKLIKVDDGKIEVLSNKLNKKYTFSITDFILYNGILLNENTEEWEKLVTKKCNKIGCTFLSKMGQEHVLLVHNNTQVKYKVQTDKLIAEDFIPYQK